MEDAKRRYLRANCGSKILQQRSIRGARELTADSRFVVIPRTCSRQSTIVSAYLLATSVFEEHRMLEVDLEVRQRVTAAVKIVAMGWGPAC